MKRLLLSLLFLTCTMLAMAQKIHVVLGDVSYASEEVEYKIHDMQSYLLQGVRSCIGNCKELSLFSPLKRQKGIEEFLLTKPDPLYELSIHFRNAMYQTDLGADRYYIVEIAFTFSDLRTGEKISQFDVFGGSGSGDVYTPRSELLYEALSYAVDRFEERMYETLFSEPSSLDTFDGASLFGAYVAFGTFATSSPRSDYPQKHLDRLFSQLRKTIMKDKGIKSFDFDSPDNVVLDLVDIRVANLYTIDVYLSDFCYNAEDKRSTCRVALFFTDFSTKKIVRSININVCSDVHTKPDAAMNEVIRLCVKDLQKKMDAFK